MTCGVYWIRNKTNNKLYIGSSNNIERRWKSHSDGKTNPHLASAQRKYGLDNFEYKVLVECSKEELLSVEQYYLDEYKPHHSGYNMSKLATGIVLTGEAKDKWLAKVKSPEYRDNMSKIMKGRVFSEEHKRKMSLAQIGNTKGRANKGRSITDIQKQQISIANTGRIVSKETKDKLSVKRQGRTPMLGHNHSEETKHKMSIKRQGRQPALGMKHTAEWLSNKSKQMKEYWARKRLEQLEKEN